MTYPANLPTITVRHKITATSGRDLGGSWAVAVLTGRLWTNNGSIVPTEYRAPVQPDGSYEFQLPPVDHPAIVGGQGEAYQITEPAPTVDTKRPDRTQTQVYYIAPVMAHMPGPIDATAALVKAPAGREVVIHAGPMSDEAAANLVDRPGGQFAARLTDTYATKGQLSEVASGQPLSLSDVTVAAVADDDDSATIARLNARFARTDFWRYEDIRGTLSTHESRVVLGSPHNRIAAATGDAVIMGGGRANMENVIGGKEDLTSRQNQTTNLPVDDTVEADYSAILFGYNNVNNALASGVGGMHNLISRNADHGIILAHTSQIESGSYHMAIGTIQAKISGPGTTSSCILGGQSHTITGSSYAAAVGGYRNTISGNLSVALGGQDNTITGSSSLILGGNNSTATAVGSKVVGGRNSHADHNDSMATGREAKTTNPGSIAYANGMFTQPGDAQAETFTARRQTTDATPTTLGITGTATTPLIALDTMWVVRVMVVAKSGASTAGWEFRALVQRATSSAAIIGTPNVVNLGSTGAASTWQAEMVSLGGGSGAVVRVTGEDGKTIRWVARYDVVQVQG